MGTVCQHSLAAEGLTVYLENRVYPKLSQRKREVFKQLLEIGTRGSSWRCVDARVPEIVAFGGMYLHKLLLGIIGTSQQRPNTIYIFYFETNIGRQDIELNRLKTLKANLGPGQFFSTLHGGMKGMMDISRIVLKKTADEKKEEKEAEEAKAKAAYDATHSVEALDAQVAALALAERQERMKAQENGEDEEADEEEMLDALDDFF